MNIDIDLNQLNLDANKEAIILGHSDLPKNSLAQGKFKDLWYYGKLLDYKGKKVNWVVFSNGSNLMNLSDLNKEGFNEFEKADFRYYLSLLPLNNTWSIQSIKEFIKLTGGTATHTTHYTQTTQTTQTTQENITLEEKSVDCVVSVAKSTAQPRGMLVELNTIQQHFMDLHDPRIFTLVSCYIISTYCFELFKSLGYLFLYSDSGSGKTKFANIIGYCSFNTTSATSPSESVLFCLKSISFPFGFEYIALVFSQFIISASSKNLDLHSKQTFALRLYSKINHFFLEVPFFRHILHCFFGLNSFTPLFKFFKEGRLFIRNQPHFGFLGLILSPLQIFFLKLDIPVLILHQQELFLCGISAM